MAPRWLKTMNDSITVVILREFKMSKIYTFKFKAKNSMTKSTEFV